MRYTRELQTGVNLEGPEKNDRFHLLIIVTIKKFI